MFRNDDGAFVDVSVEAGIYGSVIGFGLGVTIGDIDLDGWPDIYVSNDFFEKDYIYINKGDGTFAERLEEYIASISVASMGADMADINNDGNPDIFVTEMLPHDERRIKTKTTFEDWDRYNYAVENDYYHQFTRNMLHVSNGDGSYSELGRMAGVHSTDWSWGALISDFDNDGYKDLFVSNGIYKDLTDQDFLNFISNEEFMKSVIDGNTVDFKKLIDVIPSERISNFMFKNHGGADFKNVAQSWGLDEVSHSNGSAYGDLDNDGDLDLVVNNVNMPSFVYKNNLEKENKNYIQVNLQGKGKNSYAIGSKVYLHTSAGIQYLEFNPMKGFQSSMDYLIHFGVAEATAIDSLVVIWPDGYRSMHSDVPINTRITLDQKQSVSGFSSEQGEQNQRLFSSIEESWIEEISHIENVYVDFDRDKLLYTMKSTEGPSMCIADFNGDGREDLVLGGAKDQPTQLFIQHSSGSMSRSTQSIFDKDAQSEDLDITAIDVENDGDLDLYVCSGGNEFSGQSSALRDRIYINNGKGQFSKYEKSFLPNAYQSTSTVSVSDYDGDGDDDIFLGERLKPFAYGVPCSGLLLQNDGEGNFKNVTSELAPGFKELGMITDAKWGDIDGDGKVDLVVVGDYMPIKIFINDGNALVDKSDSYGMVNTEGWWNQVVVEDLNGDGKQDIVAGNHGLNSRFKASVDEPVCMHINDFDKNRSVEQIICTYQDGKSYPLALRHDLVKQLPHIRRKYTDYETYALQTVEDIFSEEERKNMLTLYARELRTSVFINQGNTFNSMELPMEVQNSPVYGIMVDDVNDDGQKDILLGGNLYKVKPEIGRYDASYGHVLLGDGRGEFKTLPADLSGLKIKGEIRAINQINIKGEKVIAIARNNDHIELLKKEAH